MQQNDKPDCFGQLWSINATECTGGYDVAYTSPNGSHIRPKCDYFEECGRAARGKSAAPVQIGIPNSTTPTVIPVQGQQQQTGRPVIPLPQSMAAPNQSCPASAPKPPTYTASPNFQYPHQPVQPQAPVYNYTPPTPQQHPYYGIQAPVVAPQIEVMPKNWFSTPSVLAVHEPREERPWASLGVEIFRGMCMITGLVSADFFSNIPLLKKPGE